MMVKNKRIPTIRFKKFEDEWEENAIENVAQFFRGKLLSWKDIVDDGKYECILYGNLYTDYGMIINNVIYKTNAIIDDIVLSKYGDVLIPSSDTTPTGLARASCIEKDNVILGGDINVIRPASIINGSFLSLNLNCHKTELIKLIKGSTVRHLDNSDIKKIKLFISKSLTEQTQIGNYFKGLDTLIQSQEQKLEKVKNLKKAMLQKMFPTVNADIPEIRFKGFNEKWKKKKLGEVLRLESGYAFLSKYFQEDVSQYIVLTPGNVNIGGGFQSGKGRYYNIIGNYPSKFLLKPNDMFITMTDLTPTAQTLGLPAFVPKDGNCYLHNQRLGKLVDFQGDMDFLFQLLCTNSSHNQIIATASGTTVKHSSTQKVMNCTHHFPSLKEQQKIGAYFQNLDQLIVQSQKKIKTFKNLKQAMLQKMFI